MLLLIDEVTNISSDNTILFSGSVGPCYTLAADIEMNGMYRTFWEQGSLRGAMPFMLQPIAAPGSTVVAPSLSRAKALYAQWSRNPPPLVTASWPYSWSAGGDASLYVSPYMGGGPLGPNARLAYGANFIIVPPTGNLTALRIDMMPFTGMGEGEGWAADDTGTNYFLWPFLNEQTAQTPLPANETYMAMRIYMATIPTTDKSPLQFLDYPSTSMETMCRTYGWTLGVVRTMVLPDVVPFYEMDSDPGRPGNWCPTSPLWKIGVNIGDAPYVNVRHSLDFSYAQVVYEEAQAARNGSSFGAMCYELVQAALTIGGFFAPNPGSGVALYGYQSSLQQFAPPGAPPAATAHRGHRKRT